jgi:hypothetical protein
MACTYQTETIYNIVTKVEKVRIKALHLVSTQNEDSLLPKIKHINGQNDLIREVLQHVGPSEHY